MPAPGIRRSAFSVTAAIDTGRSFRRDPLAFLRDQGEWGDVMQFQAGLSRFTLVNHPDLIRRVLVTDNDRYGEGKWTLRGKHVMRDCLITREGDRHRSRRTLLAPSFALRRLSESGPAMVGCIERAQRGWRAGQTIDLKRELSRLAVTIAAAALFDADLESEADELAEALAVMAGAISLLPLPRPRLVAARRRVERTAARLTSGHLMSRLGEAGLRPAEVRNEVVALLIAATDTTPRALVSIWTLLSLHAAADARVHEELLSVLGGRAPAPDDVSRLPFLQMVVNEALRLHPPVHFIDRRPLEDVELAGVPVREGSYLLLSPLVTQRDPRFFDEPEAFRPERWAPDGDGRPARLSFPFGAGPHGCIGESLARLEIVLTLATLASRWQLRPSGDGPTARVAMTLEPRT